MFGPEGRGQITGVPFRQDWVQRSAYHSTSTPGIPIWG